jgi:predicted nucleic acid-binding protein
MKYLLDTNIIIRFLANDHKEHSPAAYRLFEQASKGEATLFLDPIVISECIFVMTGKYYQVSREKIASLLVNILNVVQAEDKDTVLASLHYYGRYNVDFPDAYIATAAENKHLTVATFNLKDFTKMGVNSYQPF